MVDLQSELNERQYDAARHVSGPLLVLAGAGSGKTRVITYKIAHLIENCGYMPWQILAVTFTNKAAKEMRERASALLGPEAGDVWIGTFHSICLRVLRRHADLVSRKSGFVIYDQDDKQRLLGRCLKELRVTKEVITPRTVSHWIDEQKHRMKGHEHPDLGHGDYLERICTKAYALYEEKKAKANAFDFSDLIFCTVKLMEDHPPVLSEWQYRWKYVMVDEFQDTDHAQYKLLKMLAGEEAKLCVVGDDDQSIYRWRGADVSNILGFPDHFPGKQVEVVRLEQNYRSTGNILAAASHLIRQNRERHDKTLWTEQGVGETLSCFEAETESGEARWVVKKALQAWRQDVPLSEIAIFYRTHSQSRVFEDALRGQATPYIVVGGLKFYERKEVKDVMAYMRVVLNPADDIGVARIINTPARGIGKTTLDRAQDIATKGKLGLFEALTHLASTADGKRAKRSLESFRKIIDALQAVSEREKDAFRVAEAVLAETGYLKRLQEDRSLEAETRAENVQELMLSIQEWRDRAPDRSLTAFIDHVSLLTSMDEGDGTKEAITLMTVHAAKGLEYDTVFVTGMEENVFPHANSKEEAAIEEERRLAYVAITRGKRRVSLTWARSRSRFGRTDANRPSRFLADVPEEVKSFESEMGRKRPTFAARNQGATWTRGPAAPRTTGGGGGTANPGGWAGRAPAPQKPPTRERTDQHGRTLDYSESQTGGDHGGDSILGRKVMHPKFGAGTVARVDGMGPDARVTVQFPAWGQKRIVARFLELAD